MIELLWRTSRDWFLALHLIGLESGARFLDQSHSEVKQSWITFKLR